LDAGRQRPQTPRAPSLACPKVTGALRAPRVAGAETLEATKEQPAGKLGQSVVFRRSECLRCKQVDYRVVPRAVFCEPAIAAVGQTEREALEAGHDVRVGKFPFSGSGRAKAIGQTEGFVKIVADAKTNEILGAHIIGPHADILIHEIVAARYRHGTPESIVRSIHIHPTLSEVVKTAAKAVGGAPAIQTGE